MRICLRSLVVIIGVLFLCTDVWAEPATVIELPPPSSAEEIVTPMDMHFVKKPAIPRITEWFKRKVEHAPPFLRDSKLSLHVRSTYLYNKQFDNSRKEAWTLGGWLEYESGLLYDRLGFSTTLYTSQPIHAPDNRDGTYLLKTGQKGFSVVGQAYGRIKIWKGNEVRFFRQAYNTPYINKNDNRSVPNTFEGYTLHGILGDEKSTGALKYVAGYVSKFKERNEDTFAWMSEAAGADIENGTFMAGALFDRGIWSVGAIEYYTDDTLNIFYSEANRIWELNDGWGLGLHAQFSHQQSVGDNLLTGSSFSTFQGGVSVNLSYSNTVLTAAYTSTDEERDMASPWGAYPGYTSCQLEDFNRAGEEAWMLKTSYDFKSFVKGLTFYALYTRGTGREDYLTGSSLPDQREFDADMQYHFQTRWLKGFALRLRYGTVHESGGDDMHETRVYINYNIPLL